MKLVRSIALSFSIASVSVLTVACGGSVEHSPQTSASAQTKAPIGANTHGVVRLIGEALGEVPLRAEQRAEIEKLASEAEARRAPAASARKELMLAVADQVERGSIDRAALQAKIDKIAADAEKVRGEDRAALVKLHDLLDSEQRNLLVDAIEKQFKGKRKHVADGQGFGVGLGPWHELSKDLKLTDAQKSQIRDVVRETHKEDRAAWKAHARAGHGPRHRHGKGPHGFKKGLEAFRQDKLDLDASPTAAPGAMAKFGTERMTTFAEKVLPILTPEQRKVAADKLRAVATNGDTALRQH
ncbi:MAG TPA: Spy/CpxP family protein refolding chaperone [Labilithrix sp.]|nr:Spy/CpxP family protein refolding chaperone [Labilithrix sp.]